MVRVFVWLGWVGLSEKLFLAPLRQSPSENRKGMDPEYSLAAQVRNGLRSVVVVKHPFLLEYALEFVPNRGQGCNKCGRECEAYSLRLVFHGETLERRRWPVCATCCDSQDPDTLLTHEKLFFATDTRAELPSFAPDVAPIPLPRGAQLAHVTFVSEDGSIVQAEQTLVVAEGERVYLRQAAPSVVKTVVTTS